MFLIFLSFLNIEHRSHEGRNGLRLSLLGSVRPQYGKWPNRAKVHNLGQTQQADSHKQSQQATTVGKEIRHTVQLTTLGGDKLRFLEVDRQSGQLHSKKIKHSYYISCNIHLIFTKYPGNSSSGLL